VTLGPYRRGERWAWWALLILFGVSQLLSLIRAIALATTVGAGTSGILLALVLLALMAGVPRMFQRSAEVKL
jgi:ABC-type transport system involved in cytochrome c biogenesis permease component